LPVGPVPTAEFATCVWTASCPDVRSYIAKPTSPALPLAAFGRTGHLRVAARGSGQVRGDPAGVRAGRLGVPAGRRAGPDRGAEAAGDPIAVLPVLPVLFHLLW